MILKIAENIRRYRRAFDLTQEEFAEKIGMSPQSVSKWVRGDGYPDITLLPAIARFFKVSIDELIGNDDLSREERLSKFYEKIHTIEGPDKIVCAREMYQEDPNNWEVAQLLANAVLYADREHLSENLPLLRSVCEHTLAECTNSQYRSMAVNTMILACDDDELGRWTELCPGNYFDHEDEIIEERYWYRGDGSRARIQNQLNNLQLITLFLGRDMRYIGIAEKSVDVNRRHLKFISDLCGGVPSDGWLEKRAFLTLRLSAGYFGCGQNDKGYAALEEAVRLFEAWFAIPDGTELDMGNETYFGSNKLIKGTYNNFFYDLNVFAPENIFSFLTQPSGWEWFNSVRDDPRYKAQAAKIKALCK